MRLALVCLLHTGCGSVSPNHVDPAPGDCEGGTMQFVTPVAGEHYDPANLIAQLAISKFYVGVGFGIEIYDDAGNEPQPTAAPAIKDLNADADSVTWQFANLTPATRYTLHFSTIDCDRTETFFTN